MPARRTHLAWKNLTHDWRRLAVACMGIGFAVLLMFVQVGFENALFDSQVRLLRVLRGDIFITSKAKFAMAAEKRFPVAKLNQARGVRGVAGAYPLYTDWNTAVLRQLRDDGSTSKGRRIRTIALRPGDPIFADPDINAALASVRDPGTAVIDSSSAELKFPFATLPIEQLRDVRLELAGKRLELVGAFDLGPDFVNEGNLLMSDATFARYFTFRNQTGDPLAVVDLGVVMIEEGAKPKEVARRLEKRLGSTVRVSTRREFRKQETDFWKKSTPIGAVFWAGKIIGFIVGVVICYQVIFSDISDHIAEFATLRAMGYNADYFTRLIVVEALLLACFGFIPGALVSWGLYSWLAGQTGLLMEMTLGTLGLVFAITVVMCVVSGLLAVRKLLTADPASLF